MTGSSVTYAGSMRVTDRFANARFDAEGGKQAAAQARSDALGTIQSIVAPTGGETIGDRANDFYSVAMERALVERERPDDPRGGPRFGRSSSPLLISGTAQRARADEGYDLVAGPSTASEIARASARSATLNQQEIQEGTGAGARRVVARGSARSACVSDISARRSTVHMVKQDP